jgi:hypothetical protein
MPGSGLRRLASETGEIQAALRQNHEFKAKMPQEWAGEGQSFAAVAPERMFIAKPAVAKENGPRRAHFMPGQALRLRRVAA